MGVGGELEKVKVTHEQAKAIDYFRKTFVENKATSMSNKTLIAALNYGYEVEPVYTEGDWVVHLDSGRLGTIYLNEISEPDVNMGQEKDGLAFIRGKFRHATPEEIQQEKERRWWAKHGREVWELKQGDFLVNRDKVAWEVTKVPEGENHCFIDYTKFYYDRIKENFMVLCFNENRLDK